MKLNLIAVPYHLDLERTGMGLGPERFMQAGIARAFRSLGHDVEAHTVLLQGKSWPDAITAVAEINATLAERVRGVLESGRFPLVLAGSCNACLGALAGIDGRPVGIVWLDSHGDFNTPATSTTGFLDGMPLAIATGLCHGPIWARIGGAPSQGSYVVHVGGRDFDHGERERLEGHQVQVVPASRLKQIGVQAALRPALGALRAQVPHIYLHVDLDVLNPDDGRANEFAAPGGPSLSEVEEIIRMVGEERSVIAAALTAYNPDCDEEGRALGAGIRLLHAVVGLNAQPGSGR